ncbi:MAG: RpiB/LacA/LacB family sugar-phosphate isomerase [Candidatus Thermoplasmatota archaeon]|nr:RpiB/LacA/LacB family sugar-phosphate isomerase [Candidatus Thermoplasmatota archaeon]
MNSSDIIAIGSDHGGYELKSSLIASLKEFGVNHQDIGTHSENPVDYIEFAVEVAGMILKREASSGILCCSTGQGMAIIANRFRGIRAAMCPNKMSAVHARRKLDANIMIVGTRTIIDSPREILWEWLSTHYAPTEKTVSRIERLNSAGSLISEWFNRRNLSEEW